MQVLHARTGLLRLEKGRVAHSFVGKRDVEAVAKGLQLLLVQLLLLVRDVLAFAGFAEPISLNGLGQHNCRLTAVKRCGTIGRIDLERIVAAPIEFFQLLVGEILDHGTQSRRFAEEVLAYIRTRFHGVFLKLPVHYLLHAFSKQALCVGLQQRIPVTAPNHFDAVPAGAR